MLVTHIGIAITIAITPATFDTYVLLHSIICTADLSLNLHTTNVHSCLYVTLNANNQVFSQHASLSSLPLPFSNSSTSRAYDGFYGPTLFEMSQPTYKARYHILNWISCMAVKSLITVYLSKEKYEFTL